MFEVRFKRNRKAYVFQNRFASLSWGMDDGMYRVHVHLPTMVGFVTKRMYIGPSRPFRHLGAIAMEVLMASVVYNIFVLVPILVVYLIGRGFYVLSCVVRIVAYIMMYMPNSAKDEIREIGDVWGSDF